MSRICEVVLYIKNTSCEPTFIRNLLNNLFDNQVAESGANLLGYWSSEQDEWIAESHLDSAVDQIVAAGGGTVELKDSRELQFQVGIRPEHSPIEPQGFVILRFDRAELANSDHPSDGFEQVILYAKRISSFLTPLFGHGGYDLQWIDFDIREAPRQRILERMSWINFLPTSIVTAAECEHLRQIPNLVADCDYNPRVISLAPTPIDQLSIRTRREKILDFLKTDH